MKKYPWKGSIRKLKGTAPTWVRYHISMLTALQPQDNCSVANARAGGGCQGTRCCCWKENFFSSASGSCKCNPQRTRASGALQRGTPFRFLNAVYITKNNLPNDFFLNWLANTRPGWTLHLIFLPVSDHIHEDVCRL